MGQGIDCFTSGRVGFFLGGGGGGGRRSGGEVVVGWIAILPGEKRGHAIWLEDLGVFWFSCEIVEFGAC